MHERVPNSCKHTDCAPRANDLMRVWGSREDWGYLFFLPRKRGPFIPRVTCECEAARGEFSAGDRCTTVLRVRSNREMELKEEERGARELTHDSSFFFSLPKISRVSLKRF